ncbi:C2 domain-containing protein 3 [Blyttiomyces sp. JEL0837]|nr:C2 domain-containing protein 3 [Blyttiomyces sp. JEL0837]
MMATGPIAETEDRSLPPHVSGKVRFYLKLSIPKIVWTDTPHVITNGPQPLILSVSFLWWGQDGPPEVFFPTGIGDRRPSSQVEASSSTDRKTTTRYPVRCQLENFFSYLKDMDSLTISVYLGNTLVGNATVNDVKRIAAEPSPQPINGWFSVFEQGDTNKNKPIAKLHVSAMLESATKEGITQKVAKDSTSQLIGVPMGINEFTTAPMQFPFSTGMGAASGNLAQSKPSFRPLVGEDPFLSPIRPTPHSGNVSDDEHSMGNETPKAHSKPLELNPGEGEKLKSSGAFIPGSQAGERSTLQEMYEVIFNKAVRLQQEIHSAIATDTLQPQVLCSGRLERGPIIEYKSGVPAKQDGPEDFDEELDQAIDDGLSLDNFGTPILSEMYDSDYLDDDLIIEALNSNKVKHVGALNDHDDGLALSDSVSENELEDSLFPDDIDVEKMSTQRHPRIQERAADLDYQTVAALGRVNFMRVFVEKFELRSPSCKQGSTLEIEFQSDFPPSVGDEGIHAKIQQSLPKPVVSKAKSVAANTNLEEARSSTLTVRFEHQDLFFLNANSLSPSAWTKSSLKFSVKSLTAGNLNFGASSSKPLQRKANDTRILWEATGLWKCRQVISNSDLLWTGRIPVFGAEPQHLPSRWTDAAVKRLDKVIHIGDIFFTVELLSASHYSKVNEKPTYSIKERTQVSMQEQKKSSAGASQAKSLQSAITNPPNASTSPSLLYYLFLSISTARALSIPPPSRQPTSILLSLSLRLFGSSTPPTITPPILYLPPVDLLTGKLNPTPDFNYQTTLPITVTSEFVRTNENTPLVVEVWSHDVLEGNTAMVGNLSNGDTGKPFTKGERLLGLVRLPFNHLLNTLSAIVGQKTSPSKLEQTTLDAPVMIPESEYAIIDPFSGSSRGWIRSFMALGTWTQIFNVRRAGTTTQLPSELPITKQMRDRIAGANKPQKDTLPSATNPKDNTDLEGIRKQAQREFESRLKTDSADDGGQQLHPDSAESRLSPKLNVTESPSTLKIIIHQACGIKALLRAEYHHELEVRDEKSGFTYDVPIGGKTWIVFKVFPESTKGIEGDAPRPNSFNSLLNLKPLQTSTIAESFTPKFNQEFQVPLENIDVKVFKWMRQESSLGEIWNCDRNNSNTKLLGTFVVPLEAVFERPEGIDQEWFPVELTSQRSKAQEITISSAVQISVKFNSGFDLPVTFKFPAAPAFHSRACGIELETGDLWIPNTTVGSTLMQSSQSLDEIVVRWCLPEVVVTSSDLQNLPEPSIKMNWYETDPQRIIASGSDSLVHMSVNQLFHAQVDMNPSVFHYWQNNKFVLEVVRRTKDDDNQTNNTVIGTAYLDLWDCMNIVRKAYRKNISVEPIVWDGIYPLINAESDDLLGARVAVKLRVELIKKDDSGATLEHVKASSIPVHRYSLKDCQQPNLASETGNFRRGVSPTPTPVVILRQPEPSFGDVAVIVPLNEKAIRELRRQQPTIVLEIRHRPDQLSDQFDPNGNDQLNNQDYVIGRSVIDLLPLFTGCKEISAWYPVKAEEGVTLNAQILVRVEPSENLGALMMSLAGSHQGTSHSQQVDTLPSKNQVAEGNLIDLSEDHSNGQYEIPETTIHETTNRTIVVKSPGRGRDGARPKLLDIDELLKMPSTNSGDGSSRTWTWNGTSWEDRQVFLNVESESQFRNYPTRERRRDMQPTQQQPPARYLHPFTYVSESPSNVDRSDISSVLGAYQDSPPRQNDSPVPVDLGRLDIRDFSKGLQKTLEELNTLQRMIQTKQMPFQQESGKLKSILCSVLKQSRQTPTPPPTAVLDSAGLLSRPNLRETLNTEVSQPQYLDHNLIKTGDKGQHDVGSIGEIRPVTTVSTSHISQEQTSEATRPSDRDVLNSNQAQNPLAAQPINLQLNNVAKESASSSDLGKVSELQPPSAFIEKPPLDPVEMVSSKDKGKQVCRPDQSERSPTQSPKGTTKTLGLLKFPSSESASSDNVEEDHSGENYADLKRRYQHIFKRHKLDEDEDGDEDVSILLNRKIQNAGRANGGSSVPVATPSYGSRRLSKSSDRVLHDESFSSSVSAETDSSADRRELPIFDRTSGARRLWKGRDGHDESQDEERVEDEEETDSDFSLIFARRRSSRPVDGGADSQREQEMQRGTGGGVNVRRKFDSLLLKKEMHDDEQEIQELIRRSRKLRAEALSSASASVSGRGNSSGGLPRRMDGGGAGDAVDERRVGNVGASFQESVFNDAEAARIARIFRSSQQ